MIGNVQANAIVESKSLKNIKSKKKNRNKPRGKCLLCTVIIINPCHSLAGES